VSDAIHIQGVTKRFGPKTAVESLDLSVPKGAMVGLIGPNGAGKTTSIRMVMSIIYPDQGSVSVLGKSSAIESKDRIGYLPEERGVYKKMKVLPFIRYMAKLKGLDQTTAHQRAMHWLEKVELKDVADKKCEELSKGMQQKIQFISSVIHEPELLILDEPFSGLDPVNMRLLRDLIRELHDGGTTIIFSTHVMVQAEQLCDHIVMIARGKKVLDDSLAGIRTRFDAGAVLFEPAGSSFDVESLRGLSLIETIRPAKDASPGHALYEVKLAGGTNATDAIAAITASTPTSRIEVSRPTLEDVFIELVGEAEAEAQMQAQGPVDAKEVVA